MFVKFVSFALVGTLGTLAHYSVLYVLVESQGYNPVSASGCGAIAGLFVNYILNFKLTFNSAQSHVKTFPKFALIALVGMGFNQALMASLTHQFYYLYAQILTTLVVLLWNFLANILWTFNMERTSDSSLVKFTSLIKQPVTIVGVILTIFLIRVVTLGIYPLYDPSESRYAEMGRKMLEIGDWVTPMIDYGIPFWGKPPLTIWLTAISLGVGGVNEFSARLPSLLLSLGSVWMVFHLVRVQRNLDTALSTILILCSSVLFFLMSGTVAMDLCLSFGITLALSSFWLAIRGDKPYWGYVFFLGLSVGLMAKGPITLVLAGISLGLWTLFTGRWLEVWQRLPWVKGTLLMLCLCVPWFLIAEQKTPGFLEYFFIGEHWKRFTESGWKGDLYGAGRARPHGVIWLFWLAAGFPWTLIFAYKLINALLRRKFGLLLGSVDGWQLFCLLWMLSPLLFFTLSANLIWTYVLPGLPGMALLVSDWLGKPKKNLGVLAMLVPISFLLLVVFYNVSETDFYRSQKRLVDTYRSLALADEHLNFLKDKLYYSAQFYLQGKAVELSDNDALLRSLASSGHDFYVLRESVVQTLPETARVRLLPVKSNGIQTLYHLIAGQS